MSSEEALARHKARLSNLVGIPEMDPKEVQRLMGQPSATLISGSGQKKTSNNSKGPQQKK